VSIVAPDVLAWCGHPGLFLLATLTPGPAAEGSPTSSPQRPDADLFPRRIAASSRGKKLALQPSSAALRPCGCGPVARRPCDRHQGRGGRDRIQRTETTMAQIGTFTRNDDGSFTGTIKTLTLNIKARFVPTEKDNEKSPDLRALCGPIEIGAGWRRAAKDTGRPYHSVKLDDPSFPAPIYASLVEVEGGYGLIWSR